VYYPLKKKHDELTVKYESIKLFLRGEIIGDAVLLLYELWYWTDEAEELTEGSSRFIISPEFFKKHVENYNIERRKLWDIYKNLETLGYIKRGYENIPEGGRENWFELTDKARLYFEYEDLKHIGDDRQRVFVASKNFYYVVECSLYWRKI
jgi:hypothetical protein